jgi:hypothetical protein
MFDVPERTSAQADLSSITSPPSVIPLNFYNPFNFVVYPIDISPHTPFSFLFTRADA